MREMADQRMAPKTQTWADNWNDIIRTVLFQDADQKKLMLLPENTTIIQFIERYLIEDVTPDELVINEKVRLAYYDSEGRDSGNKNVRNRYREFDIFVKEDVLRNATEDRLQCRTHLIANRLKYQLLRNYHVCGMHFDFEDEYHLWTKVAGYKRYHVTFSYKTSV